jgi:ribonuclease-3 family protein
MNINKINALVLAYIGDAVYEKYIREYLIKKGINKVNELQKEAIKYVGAKGQAKILETLIIQNDLFDNEKEIVKRARNNKSIAHPKNVDVITYKKATGLEALIGHLYLSGNIDRLNIIMKKIIKIGEA